MAVIALGAQAQTVKIMKDGQVVASYPASEFDEVIFEPASDTPQEPVDYAPLIAGEYNNALLNVTLLEMPSMGTVLTVQTSFTIEATAENVVTIKLPSVYYAAMDMDLPAVSIEGVEVVGIGDDKCSISADYATEIDSKEVKCAVSGWFETEYGDYKIVNNLNYGSMPFTLSMEYVPTVVIE